jgi:hypothetical protein
MTKWADGPVWLTALDRPAGRSRTDARECGGQEDPPILLHGLSSPEPFLEGAFDWLSSEVGGRSA